MTARHAPFDCGVELRQRARHGSWFRIRERCPACGLRYERDEENEYWLGAYTLNFIRHEVLFAAGLLWCWCSRGRVRRGRPSSGRGGRR